MPLLETNKKNSRREQNETDPKPITMPIEHRTFLAYIIIVVITVTLPSCLYVYFGNYSLHFQIIL